MIFLEDPDFTLYQGDALEVLRSLPDESVHMCVTSPPFYGLRDYGTGHWEGGDPECDHSPTPHEAVAYDNGEGQAYTTNNQNWNKKGRQFSGNECPECGARRVDQQIGLEQSPDEWVARLVDVFREVRRVLRSDGSLWVEIGDSYTAGHSDWSRWKNGQTFTEKRRPSIHPTKPKDLIGAPWLLAFALRADGWYLRSDIIWARPNPMPESVRDRPTKSHSYVFLLSKSPRYFFDQEAVREEAEWNFWGSRGEHYKSKDELAKGARWSMEPNGRNAMRGSGRNIRSVWTIPTEPLPDEHYAAFPQRLVERCILAGTSERGRCPECGAPWERTVDVSYRQDKSHANGRFAGDDARISSLQERGHGGPQAMKHGRANKVTETTGWRPTCDHDSQPVPCTVLDPFLGSGTTALVARRHGRRTIGVELSPAYCAMAARRTQQLSVLA